MTKELIVIDIQCADFSADGEGEMTDFWIGEIVAITGSLILGYFCLWRNRK